MADFNVDIQFGEDLFTAPLEQLKKDLQSEKTARYNADASISNDVFDLNSSFCRIISGVDNMLRGELTGLDNTLWNQIYTVKNELWNDVTGIAYSLGISISGVDNMLREEITGLSGDLKNIISGDINYLKENYIYDLGNAITGLDREMVKYVSDSNRNIPINDTCQIVSKHDSEYRNLLGVHDHYVRLGNDDSILLVSGMEIWLAMNNDRIKVQTNIGEEEIAYVSDVEKVTAASEYIEQCMAEIYPVGSVYTTTLSTLPEGLPGVWESIGVIGGTGANAVKAWKRNS